MKWLLIAVASIAAVFAIVAGIGALLPENHTVTRVSHFQQSPQAVWDAIDGPPPPRPGVKRFEILPPRDGHRTWKEIDEHGNAVTYEATEEIPPVRLITHIADPNLPYGGMWIHDITFEPGGCVLQITEDGQIHNPIYRFMSRFIFGYTATIDEFLKALHAKFGEAAS